MAVKLPPFDKYDHYIQSVQSPDVDVVFMKRVCKELGKKEPKTLREDFCGTHALCCEWVKLGSRESAWGVDLDPEPLQYGKEHYWSELSQDQRARVKTTKGDVLKQRSIPKVDVACALNFSYFCFKDRQTLGAYFKKVSGSLNSGGVFLMDCFGGPACQQANVEETEFSDAKFSYFWDQISFDPVTNYAVYQIHFKRKREKIRKGVFTYDWRMWSIPELRDILLEHGFKKVHVYWEGTNRKGEGNGEYKRVKKGEECDSWVAYLAAEV